MTVTIEGVDITVWVSWSSDNGQILTSIILKNNTNSTAYINNTMYTCEVTLTLLTNSSSRNNVLLVNMQVGNYKYSYVIMTLTKVC